MHTAWQSALAKFLSPRKSKKEVIGAMICGSYITGNPSKHSDLDVQIFLDSEVEWREKGTQIIDGLLIEYFANPIFKHYEYFEEDFRSRKPINAHMLVTGKILFDNKDQLKELIIEAQKYLDKSYPPLDHISLELEKYGLWDNLDNIRELYDADAEEFVFAWYHGVYKVFDSYSKFLQFTRIPVVKLRRFLFDEADQKKYHIKDFPDPIFLDKLKLFFGLTEREAMMEYLQDLTDYVLDQMGGFEIDGWKLRSPA